MIVLSVNKTEKRVVLSSVPRDTLVYIDGKGFDKLTHAYSYGGAALTVKTYEDNFDITIDSYITVNFASMEKIVDLLGGLTLTLTDAEAKHMGEYYAAWGLSGGTQKLSGKEVLAYCRVRKIDSDFKRTERQYKVLMQMYKAVKDMSPTKYGALISTCYDYINTDMIMADMIGLAGNLLGILESGAEIEHVSLVDSKYCKTGRLDGRSVVMVDNLVKTAERWRENLGITEYEPSSRLQKISKQLDATIGR
jgi:LCP family protein required for cell wall assembly